MEPSKYQSGILKWLLNETGHGCCNAVAGSGKSTTLRLGAIALQESGLSPNDIKIIVFGKANSLDLIKKFGQDWKESISTLHSAGWTLVKQDLAIKTSRGLIQESKYRKIAQEQNFIASRRNPDSYLQREGAIARDDDFVKLLDLVRLTNTQPTAETIRDLCLHFELSDVFEYSIVASAVEECLKHGENQAKRKTAFDFTDQTWLPVRWKLGDRRWFKPYKFVLVDECQDLNAAQLELAMMLAGTDGRLLFVGDPRQAIMGFAGADNRSYQKIVNRTGATELPLSLCYRCPSEHIKLVKRIFPQIPIEPTSNAIPGAIVQCDESDLNSLLKVGDMVISRKTAPLVTLCIKLIAKGIKATVKGRDIGKSIKRDLEDIAKVPGFTFVQFNEAVSTYQREKEQRYSGLDNEEQLKVNLKDKLDALMSIYRSHPEAKSIADLEACIDMLFSDDSSPVTLSTCHRAKGLEGERVFIHKAEDMPMKWRNQQAWQFEQEENLLYVALTRSKSELFIVGEPDWLTLDDEEKNEIENKEMKRVRVQLNLLGEPAEETINQFQPEEAEETETSETFEKPTKGWVNLGMIDLYAGTQIPTRHNQQTIADYAEQMQDDLWDWEREPLPKLFYDGETFYPGDGHHRILAASVAGKDEIYCDVAPGTLRDAVFYSPSANRFHGLPRTNEDKRSAVEMLLRDEVWAKMSNRAIAEHCGVSAPFVGDIRNKLEESGTVNVSSERIDKKGRKINTENIGARPGGERARPSRNGTAENSLLIAQDEQGFLESIDSALEKSEPKTTLEVPGETATPDTLINHLCRNYGARTIALRVLSECSSEDLKALKKEILLIQRKQTKTLS